MRLAIKIPRPLILCALFGFFYLCTIGAAHADATYTAGFVPLADIGSNSSKLSGLYSSANLTDYINKVFTFAISIGAIAAVLRLMYAGYLYMGQSDMWSHKGQAKTIIGDVTLGLLLLLTIYLILNQINPDILTLSALKNIQPVPTTSSESTGSTGSSGGSTPGPTSPTTGSHSF